MKKSTIGAIIVVISVVVYYSILQLLRGL